MISNFTGHFLSLFFILFLLIPAQAALNTETVEYKHGDTTMQGHLAFDSTIKGKRPGVLIVHDWMGLTDKTKKVAARLAELGYVAFAVDVYGEGVRPKDNNEAAAEAGKFRKNRSLLRAHLQAALKKLKQSELVDSDRVAAIGYCFGGGAALELARSGADLDGVVSFHGNLDTPNPEDAKKIKSRILVLHGADDPNVPMEQVEAFVKEMRAAKVDWQLNMFGNAVHSFTDPTAGEDPSKGNAYNEKADKRSWEDMKQFFSSIF